MAKKGLSDPDMFALSGTGRPSGRGSSFLRWCGRLFAIGALTFAAAYYVPLHRAHEEIIVRHEALANKLQSVERTLASTRAELSRAQSSRDELESSKQQQRDEQEQAIARVAALQTRLSKHLERHVKKSTLSVSAHDGRVYVTLLSPFGARGPSDNISVAARGALCDLGSAIEGSDSLDVAASVPESAAPGGPKNESGWQVAASRAAIVARVIEEHCGLSKSRLNVVVFTDIQSAPPSSPPDAVHVAVALAAPNR
jgi:hypothetical protein